MKTPILRLTLTAAAAAAAICLGAPASQAGTYGDAPWCAVQDLGTGNVVWDCEYGTVEACVPNVLAGNRGTCSPNPYWQGGPAPLVGYRKHRKHHVAY